ncbi:MAG TPA: hypothetical protein PLX23_09790 [Candidatus Hydrogenedens sp.]|nr:hypothetical protein [Candidatus Hydrogenedens sp.]
MPAKKTSNTEDKYSKEFCRGVLPYAFFLWFFSNWVANYGMDF